MTERCWPTWTANIFLSHWQSWNLPLCAQADTVYPVLITCIQLACLSHNNSVGSAHATTSTGVTGALSKGVYKECKPLGGKANSWANTIRIPGWYQAVSTWSSVVTGSHNIQNQNVCRSPLCQTFQTTSHCLRRNICFSEHTLQMSHWVYIFFFFCCSKICICKKCYTDPQDMLSHVVVEF